MDLAALEAELTNDPLGRGYSGMTDAQAADSLNTVNRPTTRTLIPAHEVFEAIVPGEWGAVSAENKARVNAMLAMGEVNAAGANTRATFQAAFGAGTTTRTNLAALQNGPNVSRATELGLSFVWAAQVGKARFLNG